MTEGLVEATINHEKPRIPYNSCLCEHILDIRRLRKANWSYKRIAEWLESEKGLKVDRTTIFRFVKIRARGRKEVYAILGPEIDVRNSSSRNIVEQYPGKLSTPNLDRQPEKSPCSGSGKFFFDPEKPF
jgi:IS30 family transposase